jgi:hypothetical protein
MASTLITVALCVLLAGLLVDLAWVRLPAVRRRRRETARRFEPGVPGRGAAVEAGRGLQAGSWALLPTPRRGQPRPEITVEAILGVPQLQAIGPFDRAGVPAAHLLRRVPGPAAEPDRELLLDCWDAATRRRARLVDAAAVQLGLARDELHAAPAVDPDPLLTSATWAA